MALKNSVSLREHIDAIFAERQRAIELGLSSRDQALQLASATLHEELAKLNNLRSEVIADRALFVVKETLDVQLASIRAELQALIKSQDVKYEALIERQNKDIKSLTESRSQAAGRLLGINAVVALIVTAIFLTIAVFGLIK